MRFAILKKIPVLLIAGVAVTACSTTPPPPPAKPAAAPAPQVVEKPVSPAAAANIPVTTLADADAVDGECSLREAIQAANIDSPYNECAAGTGSSDRILLTVPGTILVTAHLPEFLDSAAFAISRGCPKRFIWC